MATTGRPASRWLPRHPDEAHRRAPRGRARRHGILGTWITDELFDGATVRLDDPTHPLEVAGKQRTYGLRVGRLAEGRRARDVAENDRDRLPDLARRVGGCQLRPALEAELRPF